MTSAETGGRDTATTSELLRHVLRLSVPLALSQLGFSIMSLVDTAFVGRRSAADLAGVSLGTAVFFFLSVLAMGAVYGVEPLVSQAVGADDDARARRALRRGLVLSVAAAAIGVALIVGASALLPWSGVASDVIAPAQHYLFGRAPGLPAMLMVVTQRGYLQGNDITRPIVISMVIANVLNVPCDGVLIFGDEALEWAGLSGVGLPALGAGGAGLATSIVTWAQVFWLARATKRIEPAENEPWREALQRDALVRTVRIGMPMGAQFAGEVAFFSSVSFLMGNIGTEMLAAHQVAITISSAPFHVSMGIGSAAAVVVGQRIGRGDRSGTLRGGLCAIGTGAVFQAIVGASFLLFPELYLRAFTDDAGVIESGATLVRIAGFFSLSDGIQAVAVGALRGAGDTKWPFFLHLVAHWVFGMPTALVLAYVVELGAPGLWWGLTCGLSFSAIALTARFTSRARSGYVALAADGD